MMSGVEYVEERHERAERSVSYISPRGLYRGHRERARRGISHLRVEEVARHRFRIGSCFDGLSGVETIRMLSVSMDGWGAEV